MDFCLKKATQFSNVLAKNVVFLNVDRSYHETILISTSKFRLIFSMLPSLKKVSAKQPKSKSDLQH